MNEHFLKILNSFHFKQNYAGMDYLQPHMSAEGQADELSFWIELSPPIVINIKLTLIYLFIYLSSIYLPIKAWICQIS